MFAIVEDVVDHVAVCQFLFALDGGAGDRPELAGFFVLLKIFKGHLFLTLLVPAKTFFETTLARMEVVRNILVLQTGQEEEWPW